MFKKYVNKKLMTTKGKDDAFSQLSRCPSQFELKNETNLATNFKKI